MPEIIFAVTTNNTNSANGNQSGSVYIMNGGLTTYSNGVTMLGGSTYVDADGQNIPLQEGISRDTANYSENNTNNQNK